MSGLAGYVGLLARYVGPRWPHATLLALLLAGSIALQLLSPQFLRRFIDGALAGASLDDLALTALAFVAVALVTQLFSAAAQYYGESLGWSATNELRADLALHCLRLDLGFYKARTPGELIERVDGDVTALAGFFSRFVVNVLGSAVLLVGVLVVVTLENVIAGVALVAFAIIAVAVLLGPLRIVAVRGWRQVRETVAQMYGAIGEHLSGTEDIRSSGAEDHVLRRLAVHHRAWLAARRTAMVRFSLIEASTFVVFGIGNAVAFGVGGYLWNVGAITVGTVYLLFYYTELLRRPIEQLRRELEDLQRAVASVGRVGELFAMASPLATRAPTVLPAGALGVALERVTFRYEPDAEPALRDVSCALAPGRVLGLLGHTGSGKTTLARLLVRFYDPSAGVVRLGGVDLRDVRPGDVRGRATLVTQDVQIFHGSVRDNVAFFDRTINDERIAQVLDLVGLGDRLAMRAGTTDRERILATEMSGASLSAGEAQLLAFARVFLRDPGLVVLDEASSRLDPATERLIESAVGRLLAMRTGVIIAHRLETVRRCDEILILEAGRLVEHGMRRQLAEDPSTRFSALLRSGLAPVLA
jgi:ATP-binding cassette subfamily B protein